MDLSTFHVELQEYLKNGYIIQLETSAYCDDEGYERPPKANTTKQDASAGTSGCKGSSESDSKCNKRDKSSHWFYEL